MVLCRSLHFILLDFLTEIHLVEVTELVKPLDWWHISNEQCFGIKMRTEIGHMGHC